MSGDRGGCSVLEDLVEVEIQKVIGPVAAGAAVLLGNDEKSFVVYIGVVEAQAIRREQSKARRDAKKTNPAAGR